VARYIGTGYVPTMTVEALNRDYITPGYHDNHRLFQYSGGHNETWGSVTLQVDNNAAAGLVAIAGGTETYPLNDAALLTLDWGWLWLGQEIFAGTTDPQWQLITPPVDGEIRAVHFHDSRYGWVAVSSSGDEVQIWRTVDGGQNWQQPVLLPLESPVQAVSFDFLTSEQGWLVAKFESGANFNQGLLFHTADGGQNWQQLSTPPPGGDTVAFVSDQVGWQVGGATHSDLYVTRDGGNSWQQQSVPDVPTQLPAYHPVRFTDTLQGSIVGTVYHPTQPQLALYTTTDGGWHWQVSATVPLTREVGPGVRYPQTNRGTATDLGLLVRLPPDVIAISMASPEYGWAVTQETDCIVGQCAPVWGLHQTNNGGQSWRRLPLPANN
jgi:photosystem II stability/assembly factor-like uncharacterized protein